jgi:hypothetical protein
MDGLTDKDIQLAGMILVPDKFRALIREMIEMQCQAQERHLGPDESELLSYVETSEGFPVPPSLDHARIKLLTALRMNNIHATRMLIEETLEMLGVPVLDKSLRR